MTKIHKTAIIDKSAKIHDSVYIGPYSIIGPEVTINADAIIQSNVVIMGKTFIGKKNIFYPFSSIGNPPQDLKFKGEKSELIIGDNNGIKKETNKKTTI